MEDEKNQHPGDQDKENDHRQRNPERRLVWSLNRDRKGF
jgi:hypothetical protein